ncbi:transcriptional regulator [Luteimonas sp. MC1825]|uniref:helix-turn-helix transcriptional regulator n=1 Tax=Luteimonas sp. MC1825 TaxID=2761107 RepID=UPI001612A534|nr:transcriptional regulator [Luteimonas sp. MC1825]MBB6599901.1 transcriptional regulator [Luteimonas sp. MC1825]QOC87613.1 transcriptional regulator [Luteimonas sp. MC1825]
MAPGLAQFSGTRQRLLRQLLAAVDGLGTEELCQRLRVSHNAVRQHITALAARGLVGHGQPRATGGRPQSRYVITAEGRALFPRNYGAFTAALLTELHVRMGDDGVGALLQALGRGIAATQPSLDGESGEGLARALAQRLDALGYEAVPARHGEDWQVEAFNCVFHDLARQHPQVCSFDLAYIEASTGRRVHHVECMARGGHACRFRLGPEAAAVAPEPAPPAVPRSPGAAR